MHRPIQGIDILVYHPNWQIISNRKAPPADDIPTQTSYTNLTSQGCEAKPITTPQRAETRGSYQCVVDYDHQPFCMTWWGSPEYPEVSKFPLLENVYISTIQQTSEMALLWRDSTMIDYGAHASIRITEHGRFPILKFAHSDELSIKLIQHEFHILADLTKFALPVVEFASGTMESCAATE